METRLKNAALIKYLKETIHELLKPLDIIQRQLKENDSGELPDSCDLIMGELTAIAIILINTDLNISRDEMKLLNDFREAIYGDKYVALSAIDYNDLCHKFQSAYPKIRLSIEVTPYTINNLQDYDRLHSTVYTNKAKDMFFRFAKAIVKADDLEDWEEHIVLRNYKDVLYPRDRQA